MTQLSSLFAVFAQTVAPIFIIIVATILVGRWKPVNVQTLSRISIYLFSPALIFTNILNTDMSTAELSTIVVAAIVCCTLMAALGALIARIARFERKLASSFVLAAFVMNSVNFGFPFLEFAYGAPGLEPAVVFSVGQAMTAYLIGTFVASRGSGTIKTAVRNTLTIPMPYAFAIALALNASNLTMPEPIMQASRVLSQGIVPVALVILGLQLGGAQLRGRWRPILLATATRFGVGAAVAFGVAALFSLQELTRQVFILEASMPAGILSGVLSAEFGSDAEFAAATILVTTLASALVLPILLLLVQL